MKGEPWIYTEYSRSSTELIFRWYYGLLNRKEAFSIFFYPGISYGSCKVACNPGRPLNILYIFYIFCLEARKCYVSNL